MITRRAPRAGIEHPVQLAPEPSQMDDYATLLKHYLRGQLLVHLVQSLQLAADGHHSPESLLYPAVLQQLQPGLPFPEPRRVPFLALVSDRA